MKQKERKQAIEYRKQGMSILEIANILGVSKASVSLWVRNVVLNSVQKRNLKSRNDMFEVVERRRQTRLKNEDLKRENIIREAEGEIESLDQKDLKIAGVMLYLAEGGKTQRGLVRFSNSNPQVIRLMMNFLSKICNVPAEKFKGHIHTHSKAQALPAEKYWSDITGIDRKSFFKTYIKPSTSSKSLKNNLPFGTFDIYVCDTKLFLRIKGWTNKILQLLLA
ncbi:MAG: helix-turn-helix domain-containing protein [Candidatus Pacebacteria bacterium]|nr:helix-turn-helix domain-containing protein [Candidatus Paceibacterota bacterium]MBP9818445.1 helix-turn-helix domain-containing protein [Candidatus Paceibacterota bacterium]